MIKKVSVAVLVAVLAFAAGYFYQQDRRHHAGRHGRHCSETVASCAADCQNKQVDLYNLITLPQPDTQAIFAKIDEISAMQKEVQKQTVRDILTKINSLPPTEKTGYLDRLNMRLCGGKGQRGCGMKDCK
jgi:hypothetical protein